MFTGLIQAVGKIASIESKRGDARVRIDSGALDMSDVKLGDSIAVSGVCLTVVEQAATSFATDVSGETLSCTTFAALRPGDPVNLEKALLPTTRLGGHLVSGHVDGVGRILERRDDARSIRLRIEVPAALAKYIAAKGSICVDGVSLTVNAVQGATFEINIIPHTATQTTIGDYAPGGRVNLEVDVLARYLERLMLGEDAARPESRITRELLERYGFAGLRAED